MKRLYFSILLCCINFAAFALSNLGGGGLSSGIICAPQTNALIQNFSIDQSGGAANLNSVVFTTTGTYGAGDVTNYYLRYNTTNNIGTSVVIGILPGAGAGTYTFTSLSAALPNSATTYYWITVDVPVTASAGATVSVSALTSTSITVSSGGTSGVSTAGGNQTIYPTPAAITSASSTFFICQGSCISVGDITPGGVFTSGTTGVATVSGGNNVCGVSTGNANITYSIGGTCNAVATVSVNTVLPAIGPSLLSPICVNQSVTLTDLVPGGTWTSLATGIASVNPTGVVTGVSNGSTNIVYTVGACSTSKFVSVNPLPPAIVGPTDSICAFSENTVTLTDPDPTGTWTSTGVTVTAGAGNEGHVEGVGPASSGNCVTYTIGTGCSAVKCFDVHPWPATITGSDTLCASMTTTLHDVTSGGSWTSSTAGVVTVGGTTGVALGVGAGDATITYSDNVTHCYNTQHMHVYAFGPITGPAAVCQFSSATYSDTTSGGVWSTNPVSIATVTPTGANTSSLTGITAGLDSLIYTIAAHGCRTWDTVRVYNIPSAITGISTVCVGSTLTLGDPTSGGTWSITPTGTATIDVNGVVTGVAAGFATVSYTTPATGCYITGIVTVNPLPSVITGADSVCVGSVTTLNSGPAGGTWTVDGSGNASILSTGVTNVVLSGISAGPDVVTFQLPSGCARSVVLTVNPLPAPISGTLTVCAGYTTTLTDGGTGTWVSYNAGASVGLNTGIVTGNLPSRDSIVYSLTTGCNTYAFVTVNALPATISGPSAVCVGDAITFTDGSTGAWSASPASVATINPSGVLTGVGAGTATVSFTGSAAGCFVTSLVTVNPLPSPITAATFAVCSGTSISLTDADAGGSWTSNDNSIATVDAFGNVFGLPTTTIKTTTITYTLPTGCPATHGVTVYPLPADIAGPSAVCIGATITLTDATFGGSWLSSNAVVATVGGLTGYVTGVSLGSTSGAVTITYTSAAGCYKTKPITVNPLPLPITSSATVMCANQLPITMSDATLGGSWSGSPSPSVISVTDLGVTGATDQGAVQGNNGGIATVSYSLPATGCFVTFTITVNAAPEIESATNEFCLGSTVALWEPSLGGTWVSSVPSVAAITHTGTSGTLDSVLLTCLTTGSDLMGYFMTNGCTVFYTFECNPVPAPITGSTFSVCQGTAITLSDGSVGGTYALSNGNATGVQIDPVDEQVTGVLVGLDTLTYSFPIVGAALSACSVSQIITVNPLAPITGILSVCQGGTTTLSNTTPGSGSWSSQYIGIASVVPVGGFPTLGVVTGVTPGVDSIAYNISATGCTAYAAVTVNGLPIPIMGGNSVCIGGTITLSDLSGPGTWSSSLPGTASIDPITGVVAGIASGSVIITYTMDGTGCYVTQIVNVNAGPSSIVGPAEICPGVSVSYTDASSVTWSSNDNIGLFIVSTTGIATGLSTGVYTITASNGFGCVATMAVTVTTIDPITLVPPTVLPISVCMGQTILLADGTTGGTWSSSDNAIATIDPTTGYVNGIHNGTVTITYSLVTGCYTLNSVNVNPVTPILGSDTLCEYLTTSLSDATLGGVWSSDNSSVATISSTGVVLGVDTGSTLIHYVTAEGCIATSPVFVVGIEPIYQPGLLTSVCTGATISLTDASTPFLPNPWSSDATTVASVDPAGVVTGATSGTATITYTSTVTYAGLHCIAKFPVTVNPSPAPITGPTALCAWGGTITVSDATLGGVWSASPVVAFTLTPPNTAAIVGTGTGAPPGVAGPGIVTYTLPTGCYDTMLVTINPLPDPITGVPSVCMGQTTTLHDATSGGTYSSSATGIATVDSASGVVTGITPGTATIIYTLPTGCTASLVITVNIDSPIVGPSQICTGVQSTFTDGVPGGTWSFAPAGIVTFTIGSGGLATAYVTGTTTVPVVVTASYTLPGTSCTVTRLVTVNPLPAPIVYTPAAICGTDSTLFTDITPGGMWTSSATGIATVDAAGWVTGTWTGIGAATATITYSDTTTGCLVTAPITVNPLGLIQPRDTNLCVGIPVTYSDPALGGFWSNAAPGVSGNIGGFTGIYTGLTSVVTDVIIYTMPLTGCTTTLPVTVYPQPGPITGPNMVCVGSSITLSDPLPGGVYSSSTYDGTVGTAAIAPPGTVLVTGLTAGEVTITYTMPSGCNVTYIITVNPLPAPISGPTSVCGTQSITLHDATLFGFWNCSPSSLATINSVTGQLDAAGTSTGGTVTVTYSILPVATSCSVTYFVTVNPLTSIIGPSHICNGVPTMFSDTTGVGVWSTSSSSIATVNPTTGAVTGLSNGVFTLSYTITSTGCTATMLVTVNPSPAPIVAPPMVCVGQTVSFTDATAGGTWSSHDPGVANINPTNGVDTGISSGTVIISYSFGTGCFAIKTIVVDPLAPILGPSNVCVGSAVTMTDSIPGGVWSSSASGVASVGSVALFPVYTATVTGTGAPGGTAVISYSLPTGCVARLTVTVNPLPAPIIAPLNICHFDSVLISDDTLNGVWSIFPAPIPPYDSIGDPHNHITHFYGQDIGAVTLRYTDTLTGCMVSKLIIVNPEALPMTGLFNICVGQTTTLNDAPYSPPAPAGPGIWEPMAAGYPAVYQGSGMGYGVYLGVTPGTMMITYSTPGGCNSYHLLEVSSVVTPTVDIYPGIGDTVSLAGTDKICAGQQPVFTFGTTNQGYGPTYQWYVNGTPVSTSDTSFTYSPVATGDTVKLVLISNATCATNDTARDRWIMQVLPSVAASVNLTHTPPFPVCSGNPVTFVANPTNGGSAPVYDWMVNGTLVSSAASTYTYIPTNGDSVYVSMNSSMQCAVPVPANSNGIIDTVNPSLIDWVRIVASQDTFSYYWGPILFTAEDSNFGFTPTYQWYVNNVLQPGATSDTFTLVNPHQGDSVYCKMTSSNPCTTIIGVLSNTIGIVGLATHDVNNGFNDLALAPNPNKGTFRLKGNLNTVESGEVALDITDVIGKTVYKKTVNSVSGKVDTEIVLDEHIANGVYYLRITSGGETDVRHFMIER